MSQFLLFLGALCIYAIYLGCKKAAAYFKANSSDATLKLEQANQKLGELQSQLKLSQAANTQTGALLLELQQSFGKLQHQKISADVRIGQKTENILPFLQDFPYRDQEIRGLFNPIDLIVFGDDHITFVEVKTGTAQLSDKQKNIRRIIKEGKVKFEVHRLNEKGVTVK